jgi:hypothetical protein
LLATPATGGLTAAANGTWTIIVIDATHIDLQDASFVGRYTSGGTVRPSDIIYVCMVILLRTEFGGMKGNELLLTPFHAPSLGRNMTTGAPMGRLLSLSPR